MNVNNKNFKKQLNVSIGLLIIYLFCIICYFIFIYFIKPPIFLSIIIITIETILSLLLWLFFMVKIEWLKDTITEKEIYHLNISNALSSLRFLLVPLLITIFGLTIIYDGNLTLRIIIFIFAVIIALTDIFDGILARKLKEVTKIGKIIDPIGDFLMITTFSILLYYTKNITWWFFLLILIRIPVFFLSTIFIIALDIKIKIKTTFLGRATIFYLLTFLGFATLKLLLELNNFYYDLFLFIAQLIGALIITISSVEKVLQLIELLKEQEKLKMIKDNIQF